MSKQTPNPTRAVLASLLLASCLAGCAGPGGPVFPPPEAAVVWPPPPDVARIQYVGTLTGEADLKAPKSMLDGLGEALFGAKPLRSFLSPYAVCTDNADRVFVCDSNAQVVHVLNLETRAYEQWRPDGTGRGFSQPVGLAIDGKGRLLVSDSAAGAIFVFEGDGQFLGEIGTGHLSRPCGLAYDAARERILVADSGLHQVVVLAFDGETVATIGSRGVALGEFNYPTNVAVDATGRIFVSDSLNFRVQVFDPEYRPLRQIGRLGDMPGYFAQPKGLAVDSENHVYVVDAQFEAVQIFDPEGRLLLSFGTEGHGPGEFWLPAGLHIDHNDRIWIADTYNKRIQVFDYRPEALP